MSSVAALQPEPAPIVACTISRDVSNFDLLIEDMETELGESWGDLTFDDAILFLNQPDADSLEFVAVAVDSDDESDLARISGIITTAKEKGVKIILIAEEVSPIALHQLLKLGADDFVPYPLPENALHEAIERLQQAPGPDAYMEQNAATPSFKPKGDRNGVILPVHGLAGGTGATTLAVNLAWELALIDGDKHPSVCLIDLDLQFGSVGTYLDLPRRETVFEMLADTENMDEEVFGQALLNFKERLQVLTAPTDLVPLDIIDAEDVQRVIDLARSHFDYVVIDMPSTLVVWSETVLQAAHVYFATIELDMRSAQNILRLKRALQSEDLPFNKLRFALNRAPKFTDLSSKSRVKRMGESLGISIDLQLPDGGKAVMQGADHGSPLAISAAKNPLRKEIAKLARSLHDLGRSEAKAA